MTPWERIIASLHTPTLWESFLEQYLARQKSNLRPRSMLRSYQRYLAEQIRALSAILGAAEMSLGKTGATLTGVIEDLREHPNSRALIVAPLEVANNTWPDEVHEWEHLQDVTYTVVTGSEKQRLAALAVDADLTIINRENLQWLWKTVCGRKGWRWDVLVYDESSRLKGFSPRTKGTEKTPPQISEFGVLVQARSKFRKVVLLSGTPAPNGIYDLGGQARVLFGQESPLGQTKHEFETKFFDKNKYTYEITPKPGAEEQIMGHMKPVMIGLRSQDYIDLPPIHFNPVYCKLTPTLMKQYKEFEETLYTKEYDVEAVNNGVLSNKLLQMASGGLYRMDESKDPPVREVITIHDLKIKRLQSIIAEAAGQNVLIAYRYKFEKAQIKTAFPKATFFEDEPNFVKKWNAGQINIGVAHPASIGHGLNLQYGGHIQVWMGPTWSLELWDQFNRRLARPGQKAPTVFIHVIITKGTEDERQYNDLLTKGVTQDRITERIRLRSIPKAA